jgi:hypothetical protein
VATRATSFSSRTLVKEVELIRTHTDEPFTLVVFQVQDWNPGNHFMNPDQRMAKGFAWGVPKIFTKKWVRLRFFYIFAKKRLPNPYYLNLWQTLQEETF